LKILYNSYGSEVNLQKLADALGCSRQYVSKVVNKKDLS
jgi:biotin operon repressor